MKSFLRICLACFCMLAFTHTQAIPPTISEMYVYNGGGLTPITPINVPINTPIYIKFDQPVFKVPSGTAFLVNESVGGLITFSGGITFTATINGQWITIVPTAQLLLSSTTYNIGIAGNFQNAAAEVNTTQPLISFTTASQAVITSATLDLCRNGVAKVLGNIVITEGGSATFGEGINQTFEMNAPAGFNFVAGIGNVVTTGTDISNASVFVSASKITLLYDITAYADINRITLQNIQVIHVFGTGIELLKRTGGNATQSGNRVASDRTHATLTSTAPPVAPTPANNVNLCSGFSATTNINIGVPLGSTAYFYNASNVLVRTEVAVGSSVSVLATNLVSSNTTLGISPFFVSAIVGTCESVRVPFTITVTPNPVVNLVVFSGSTTICKPEQTTFQALGTLPTTFNFELSLNGGAFNSVTIGTFYTTPTTIASGNHQLRVRSTLAGGCNVVSNIIAFTVNPKPVVGFIWSSTTTYGTTSSNVGLTDGTSFGGTIGGVVSNLGTYSGTAVVGTVFYPGLAPVGNHLITYSYTDVNGCYAEANITFTIAVSSGLIPFLGTSYCATAPPTLALTPIAGGPFGSPMLPFAPINSIPSGFISSPYPGLGTLGNDRFYFPNGAGMNEGIVWNGTDYKFNPAVVMFVGNDIFKDIPITVVRFINIFGTTYFPAENNTSVRIYRTPVIDMNLANNINFCKTTSTPLAIGALVFGIPPTTGTTVVEYRILPAGVFATLPSNTITAATLPSGNYELRVTHTTPQGCANSLVRTFRIIDNPIPTFSIRNNSNVITSVLCSNEPAIKLVATSGFLGGIYSVTRISGATNSFSAISFGTTTIPLTSLDGAGSYQVTLVGSNLFGCTGSSIVGTFDIITTPLPDFTFAPSATISLTICEDATSFALSPNTGTLPVGSGFFNIKKTTTVGLGKNFGLGINTFNPNSVDFDATSGTGVGVYEIKYTYTTSVGGCQNTSIVKLLTIAPKPTLSFVLSTTNICNYFIKPTITLTPTWTGNIIIPVNGRFSIYNSTGIFLLSLPNGINSIDLNLGSNNAITSTINPLTVNTFRIEYQYTDNNGCVGISPQATFQVNPLPIPTISFVGTNEFCLFTPANANFAVNVSGGTGIFNGANGFITIRNAPSLPTTVALNQNLLNNVNTFNPSSLGASGVGEYFIDYTYTDGAFCQVTVTCPTRLILKFYTAPQFSFPVLLPFADQICASLTSLTLQPSIINNTEYGTDAIIDPTRGLYVITKTTGSFTRTVTATNTFNPKTLLADAAGGGAGVYNVQYFYTSARGCVGESTVKQLTINALPSLIFSFAGGITAFCADVTSFNLLPLVNTGAVPTPAAGFFTITKTLPIAGAPLIVLSGLNNIALASLSGVGTYEVFYSYTDSNNCPNISPTQTFVINALPITTVSFVVDNKFCADEPANTPFVTLAYVSGAGAFNPANSSFTITKGGTLTQTISAIVGTNTFNPSALANLATGAGTGTYSITHTYTDANGCAETTIPLLFDINALPAPTFTFATAVTGPTTLYEICADQPSVNLFPTIGNPLDPGVGAFVPAYGSFTIRKAGTTIIVLAGSINTFTLSQLGIPANIPGTYDVIYTYAIPGFCTNILTQTLLINPLPVVSFTFDTNTVNQVNGAGNARVCGDFSAITLIPNISGVVGTSFYYSIQEMGILPIPPPIIINSTTILPANIGILATTSIIRNFDIKFVYTDVKGCIGVSPIKTLEVVPIPNTIFVEGNKRCVNEPVDFSAATSFLQGSDVVAPNGYVWNFGDATGAIISPLNNPIIQHTFTNAQNYTVSLTITTVLGCSKTFSKNINVGSIPVANFTTSAFCQGANTVFVSTSTINNGTIDRYTWDFGDGSPILPASASPTTTHLYGAPGRYVAKLTVITNTLCVDIKEREVFIFPRITPTAALPYKDNFDGANNNTWFATGQIKATSNPLQDTTGTSWRRGIPTGVKINATTTAGGAWFTGGNNNTYYANERSFVESPCFNFTSLIKPMISMKIWYDTDRGSDAGALYASTNDGVSWNVVGTINEGIGWYNTAGIVSQPAGQSVVNAWTGDTLTRFKIAKFNLDQFKGLTSVRFRVGFGSNADNPVGRTFDGFAFDEIFIGDRNRIALLEHFTNAASSEANTENTFINNFPSVAAQTEIYNIQYHTNFPGNDPMNNDNTADPSARALFYGVSQVPRTAIDGVIENRKFSEWGTPVYNKRTLETAPFEISVSFPTIPRELLNITATVKALEPFARRVIVHTVVVEQEILGTVFTTGNFGGLTFKNVVKKMVPNAAGSRIDKTWLAGAQEVLNLNWNPTKVYNSNKLVVVVFVQDDITKEIYQAAFFNVTTSPTGIDPTTALDPQTQAQTLENEFVVYPNPAQNEVFTGFRNEIAEDFSVVLFDSYGKKLGTFSLPKGNKGILLNTEIYASGMYFVEITGKNNIKARRKLVIAR